VPVSYQTFPELMAAIDPQRELGTVARRRIDAAHDIALAGAICAFESLAFSDLQPPAGVIASSWTWTTAVRKGTPGVAELPNGERTRTVLILSVVGGEGPTAYNAPMLIEPAYDPTNIRDLALQAVRLAKRGRQLVREYVPEVGGVRIGSLPILMGRLRAATPHPVLGGILGEPVAIADMPEIVDELANLTSEDIPFVAYACSGRDGRLQVPEGWYLDVTQRAGSDAERPTGLAGLGELRRNGIVPLLLGSKEAVEGRLVDRVPDTEGGTWIARGCMLTQGLRLPVPLGVFGHVSLTGQPSIALTNLPRTPAGMLRLSLAIEGLLGSATVRVGCRRRVAKFVRHIDLPSDSFAAARRIFGLIVMSYRWTVIDRCSGHEGVLR
jgi:hypothetical protein